MIIFFWFIPPLSFLLPIFLSFSYTHLYLGSEKYVHCYLAGRPIDVNDTMRKSNQLIRLVHLTYIQWDQIWRNSLSNVWKRWLVFGKNWTHFWQIFMLLGQFAVFEMAKCLKLIQPSGHTCFKLEPNYVHWIRHWRLHTWPWPSRCVKKVVDLTVWKLTVTVLD